MSRSVFNTSDNIGYVICIFLGILSNNNGLGWTISYAAIDNRKSFETKSMRSHESLLKRLTHFCVFTPDAEKQKKKTPETENYIELYCICT